MPHPFALKAFSLRVLLGGASLLILARPLLAAPLSNLPEYASFLPTAQKVCEALGFKTLAYDRRLHDVDKVLLGDNILLPMRLGSEAPSSLAMLRIPLYNRLEGNGSVHDGAGWHLFVFRCDLQNSFQKAHRFFYRLAVKKGDAPSP